MDKKTLKDKFILKAVSVHGDKYDYSLVDYKNNKSKVKIICNIHGEFEQTPSHHVIDVSGCKKCSDDKKRHNSIKFIERSKKIHNNKYDYKLVEYISSTKKVKIICPKHGIFEQIPASHVNMKKGCDKCGGTFKLTTNSFIKKSNLIHDNKYDYSNTIYVSGRKKIKIICYIHGEFEQTPECHLMKSGCPLCAKNMKISRDIFLKKSIYTHNNKYDYSLSDIDSTNIRNKIKIICPNHGLFEQCVDSHMRGHGCPSCKSSKGETNISKILENSNIEYIRQKTFDGCKYKRKLKFDFYLPKYNFCIEFDGGQHFNKVDRWNHNDEKLKELKIRDQIKNDYCKNNNINLLRIKYNENIEQKIKNNII